MSKRNYIIERASDVNGGQYVQTNSSYNSGYEDGKKAGKEYCASEIEALREQIEKLTKERDEYGRRNGRLRSELAELDTKLAALAEQNAKMRSFLEFAWKDIPMNEYAFKILEHVMNLPSLATPILNKIKAEAYREAAEIAGPEDSYQDQWFKAKSDSCAKLRAKADELEKSK